MKIRACLFVFSFLTALPSLAPGESGTGKTGSGSGEMVLPGALNQAIFSLSRLDEEHPYGLIWFCSTEAGLCAVEAAISMDGKAKVFGYIPAKGICTMPFFSVIPLEKLDAFRDASARYGSGSADLPVRETVIFASRDSDDLPGMMKRSGLPAAIRAFLDEAEQRFLKTAPLGRKAK